MSLGCELLGWSRCLRQPNDRRIADESVTVGVAREQDQLALPARGDRSDNRSKRLEPLGVAVAERIVEHDGHA